MMATIDLSSLNESQRAVATRLDEPLFVAAGAGSGKTFTLTARLVHALSMGSAADGGRYLGSIGEALVITFTKAAALEIAERVRGALREAGRDDPYLHEESLKVDSAWISTIHGMCARILRRHAVELGVDPAFGICEGSVADVLMARALDEVMTDVERDEAYDELRAEYDLWGEGRSISRMVTKLRAEATKCAHGLDDIAWPEAHETEGLVMRLREAVSSMCAQKLTARQREAWEGALLALDGFCQLAPGRRTAAAACEALVQFKLTSISRKDVKELSDDARALHGEAVVCAYYERAQSLVPQLVGLARRVDARYAQLKREQSYLDNDDLIELALEAVERHPEVARDYAGRFKLVMIDEFQDTDAKQLRLISLLSGADARHLTTVGDAQQAIYRFRGGDVEVFRSRGRSLDEASHVRMDVNYRSDPHVLALVERVCGDAGLLGDFLKLAGSGGRRSRYVARDKDGGEPPRIRLEVACGGTADVVSATLAAQLADRLAAWRDMGQPQGTMALLLGTTGRVGLYLDALRARGLQAVVTGGSSFSSTPEVGVVQALLHTLANPQDTEAGLFRLLSSEMFMLDADDFCQLGTCRQDVLDAPAKRAVERCFVDGDLTLFGGAEPSPRLAAAHAVITRAFSRLATWQVADVCQAVVDESGWLGRLEGQGTDGLARAANVLAAVRYVRELTVDLGLGAARAADEFDQWLGAAKISPKGLSGDELDAVRVMTIHGSKGLQFGVCAVAECWGEAKPDAALSVGRVAGRCMVCAKPNPDLKSFSGLRKKLEVPSDAGGCRTAAEWALYLDAAQVAADQAEKARLLYVALTRAEEALVVGLPVSESEWRRSTLALGMLGAFPQLDELAPGELAVDVAPELPLEVELRERGEDGRARLVRRPATIGTGVARVVCLERGEQKGDPWRASSAGTLVGFDGELPLSVGSIPLAGTAVVDSTESDAPPFVLAEPDVPSVCLRSWRPREDVFSYSAVHERRLREEARDAGSRGVPTRAQLEAEEEGAAFLDDVDKATSLGSAFHQLAQTMAITGRAHDPARLEALARAWHLSARQRTRLEAAVANWEASDLRREAMAWPLVRAEVPFFVRVDDTLGTYAEGAIDLLCTEGPEPSGRALVVDYKTGDAGLLEDEVRARHEEQAAFYASMLKRMGFSSVACAFTAVETGVVARYEF